MSDQLTTTSPLPVLFEAAPVSTADLAVLEEAFLSRVTGWVLWPPKKWYVGIPVAVAAFWPPSLGPVPVLVCPECGEPAAACNPAGWTVPMGEFPQWAHQVDGEPLCPVMTSDGYRPAPRPIPITWFDGTIGSAVTATSGGEAP